MSPARGRFIAVEGGEGGGKTTQIARLVAWLEAAGRLVLTTREPGGTPGGAELRRLLLTGSGTAWTAGAETLLMIADRAQHVADLIEPALAGGRDVVTDRYVFSTMAYQGAGRGVAEPLIRDLHRAVCGDLWPDLVILLDLDPRIGLARSKRRLSAQASAEDRFEGLDLAFHDRVRARFLDLAAGPVPTLVVDATADADRVAAAIRTGLAGHFGLL